MPTLGSSHSGMYLSMLEKCAYFIPSFLHYIQLFIESLLCIGIALGSKTELASLTQILPINLNSASISFSPYVDQPLLSDSFALLY